jgi:hypothetical protein
MKHALLAMLVLASYLWTDTAHAEFEIAPFATGTFEYQFRGDRLLTPGCTTYPELNNVRICTGKNPRAEFKLGFEFAFGDWRNKWYIPTFQAGYKHESNWFTGAPFNDEPELFAEKLFLEFRFGGLR